MKKEQFRDLLTQIGEETNVQKLRTIGESIVNLQSDIFEEADKAKARRGYQCHAERLGDLLKIVPKARNLLINIYETSIKDKFPFSCKVLEQFEVINTMFLSNAESP